MEWILAALVVCAAVQAVGGQVECKSENFVKLTGFNGQTENMEFPCRYFALKAQPCGKYRITISPGNAWVGQEYRLNSLWLGVEDTTGSEKRWQGRTTNKIAVKFLNQNGTGRDLFNKRGGSLSTSDLFVQDIDDKGRAYVEEKGKAFRVSFSPWHPRSKEYLSHLSDSYKHSMFTFKCATNETLVPYPRQMCGNETRDVVDDKAKVDFAIKGTSAALRKRLVLYYDLFMSEDVTQMEGMCLDAATILNNTCQTQERALTVLKNCEAILSGGSHTQCVASFTCHPMEAFNSCLRWGCAGKKAFGKDNKEECEKTGKSIDLCPDFVSLVGNLTGHLDDANCYTEYLAIETK